MKVVMSLQITWGVWKHSEILNFVRLSDDHIKMAEQIKLLFERGYSQLRLHYFRRSLHVDYFKNKVGLGTLLFLAFLSHTWWWWHPSIIYTRWQSVTMAVGWCCTPVQHASCYVVPLPVNILDYDTYEYNMSCMNKLSFFHLQKFLAVFVLISSKCLHVCSFYYDCI